MKTGGNKRKAGDENIDKPDLKKIVSMPKYFSIHNH